MLFKILVVCLVIFLAYRFGRKDGYKSGLEVANSNNKNLVSQLKDANVFATELRG